MGALLMKVTPPKRKGDRTFCAGRLHLVMYEVLWCLYDPDYYLQNDCMEYYTPEYIESNGILRIKLKEGKLRCYKPE